MKLIKFYFLLITLSFLISCSKTVLPSEEKEDEIETPSNPNENKLQIYTVTEFIEGDFGDNQVWVHGYIVGACKRSIKQAEWEPPFTYNTAILLADSPEEADPKKVIAIQMTNKRMKEEIALATNPQNYGRHIAFLGIKQKYLGIPGMKKYISTSEWLSE